MKCTFAILTIPLVVCLWSNTTHQASAQTVTRGPYLQQGTPNSVVVRWRTSTTTTSRVRYGTVPGNFTVTITNGTSATDHVLNVPGLQPLTRYYYEIGTGSGWFAGDTNDFFETHPPVGVSVPTRIWVIGDSGTANANAAAVRDAYLNFAGSHHTDVWLMLGDNAYNTGTDTEYQNAVFNMYWMLLQNTILWSTRGNHESDAGGTGSTYYNIFTLPVNGQAGGLASGTEAYYSFEYGNIHFVCLDAFGSSRSATGPMATWLQNDLASVSRDWIIAFWHHPPYTKGSHNSDTEIELIEMRQNMLPILEAGGVDLVLCGHSHSYERSFLLDGHYGGSTTLTPAMKKDGGSGREDGTGAYGKATFGIAPHEGAVYVVAGSSGQISGGTLNHPAMFISLNQLGSLVLDIDGNRLDAKFLRENGTIPDYFTIIKGGATVPAAPTGLTAVAGNAQVSLSWNTSFGATSYNVKRATVSGGPYALLANVTATSYLDTAVVNNTTYFYVVSANNEIGESANSTQVSATPAPPPPPPAAPSGLTAIASGTQINLAWIDNSPSESGFKIERSTDGVNFTQIASLGVNVTSYVNTGLVTATTYYYRARAFNSGGDSDYSNIATATTSSEVILQQNQSGANKIDIKLGQKGAQSFRHGVAGNPNYFITKVVLHLSRESEQPNANLNFNLGAGINSAALSGSSVSIAPSQITDSSAGSSFMTFQIVYPTPVGPLTAGTTYYMNLECEGSNGKPIYAEYTGNNAYSGGTYFKSGSDDGKDIWFQLWGNSGAPASPPPAPTGLSATAGNAQVSLAWIASSGATSYNVKRSTTSGGPYTTIATGITSTTYANTGLNNGTTYYYVVAAVNSVGESANSAQASATPQAVPASPTGLTASTVSSSQINLNWTASSGATSYNVKRSTATGGPYTTIATGVTTTSYNNTGLSSGTRYFYVVSAVSSAGESSNSGEANAITIPAAPTGLTATAGDAQVSLNWTASTGATSYNVKRSTTSGGPYAAIALGVTSTTYVNAGLANGTTYYYVVSAVNSSGESANSVQASATPQAATSLVLLEQSVSGGNKADIKSGQTGAQSFRHGTAGGPAYTISKVVLHFSRESEAPNANLVVSIGTGRNSGAIAGSTVTIAPLSITNTSSGSSFMTFEINYGSPVGPLTAGTTYYINLACEAPNGKPIYLEISGSSAYANGTYFQGASDQGKDARFQIWGQ